MIGQSIAHYRVTAKLGAGGMGEVYRATDCKLGREVALKVLPATFSSDAERMARFQREAQVLAALNHPNIAAIYGLEEGSAASSASAATPTRALVMELVEGPTLADRIAQGPIPLDEALPIARQIAEALEYAHERGIIHRDLKPANVKLTVDGKVKVLDFGLAKALDPRAIGSQSAQDLSASPTMAIAATKTGIILGTAAYMSPEQARGKPVDRRTDVWALGCVLFEMLAGKAAFSGETSTDIIASIVTRDPDWSALPPGSPVRLLRRCLERDPKRRLRDTGDVYLELEDAARAEEPQAASGAALGASHSPRALFLTAALILVALAVGAALAWVLKPAPPSSPVVRVPQLLPDTYFPSLLTRVIIAISPDGTKLAFVTPRGLYLRALESLEGAELGGTQGAEAPFFSPDGQWVGYFAGGQLKKIRVAGGTPVAICSSDGTSASWAPDNTILIETPYAGIVRVSADGGTPSILVPHSGGMLNMKPQALPDDKSFMFVRGKLGSYGDWELVVRSFAREDETVVVRGVSRALYSSSGYLIYSRGEDLNAVPFDLASRRVAGSAVTLAQNVSMSDSRQTAHFALSNTDTLVYLMSLGSGTLLTQLVAVDHSGKISTLPVEARDYSDPRISPDGTQVAAHLQGDENDVWVINAKRGTLTRISLDPGEDETPAWSPDGRWVAWASTRTGLTRGIFRRAADGSGNEELLWKLDNHAHLREWLPDGKTLILEIQSPTTKSDIWRLELGEKPTATPYLQTPFNERDSRISPDGHWIAYESDESGRDEIYIQSFPEAGNKLQVSSGGGEQPVWSRDGRSLYFRGGGSMQEVSFTGGPHPAVSAPHALFPDQFESPQAGGHTGYDVGPDGKFLMIRSPRTQSRVDEDRWQLVFVFHCFEELKRKDSAGPK